MRCATILAAVIAVGTATPIVAYQQQPAEALDLGPPLVTLEERFSSIRGLRELSSGELLVADWIEERVSLVDLDGGTVVDRVTEGGGPNEVRLPGRLVAMAGDSTLLRDEGNQRLSVLGPTGRVARTLPADQPGLLGVRGIGEEGEFLFAIPAWASREPLANDSVRVVSWSPGDRSARTRVTVQGERRRRDRSPSRELRIPVIGYAARDAWTATDDGTVVVVRGGDYRLEHWRMDGTRTVGPSYAFEARSVTAEDRRRFVEQFMAESGMSGRGADGGVGHAPPMSRAELERLAQTTEFAESHPFFAADQVLSGNGGQTWVGLGRTPEGTAYDVFGADGVRVGRVSLAGDRAIGLVTDRAVYVVRTGELSLQSIERYRLPM